MSDQEFMDLAFANLRKQKSVILSSQGTNEATTRLRAIDTMLFDVLAWPKTSVQTEKYSRAVGFSDYVFFTAESALLVLEAKKADTTFLLPDNEFPSRPVSFALLSTECPAARDAMIQASGYASTLGSRFVAITNGHQWLLCLTYVHNQAIDDRLVYVFESYGAIEERFRSFWKTFSPNAIISNRPAEQLLEGLKVRAPEKLSRTIAGYPHSIDRNPIREELRYVLGFVWDEMHDSESEQSFLEECYIKPASSSNALAIARELIETRRTAAEVQQTIVESNETPSLIKNYLPEKPIIVLGKVGHGKTTFLKYLRLVEARETLEKYFQIEIDFLARPHNVEDIEGYVFRSIEMQLAERYEIDTNEDSFVRAVLHGQIQQFKRSPRGKRHPVGSPDYQDAELMFIETWLKRKHEYLALVFHHLRFGRQTPLSLFFDNLDRRDDPIQESAFLVASAIARDVKALVFICLRPGTYFRSLSDGVLDSIAAKTIYIDAPSIKFCLRKRFNLASKIAEAEGAVERFTRQMHVYESSS